MLGSDEHMWSQSYDRDLSDVFVIQSDIAKNIADALKIRLLMKRNDAYKRFLRAVAKLTASTSRAGTSGTKEKSQSLKRAIEYFEKAIEKDADFALAYVGIADCYNVLGEHGIVPVKGSGGEGEIFCF